MYRLAYLSVANPIYQDKKNIQTLVETAEKNNMTNQLTSNLVYSEGHFFHVLEGEESVVTDTFSRIRDNKNHRVVHYMAAHADDKTRLFPDSPLSFAHLSRVAKFSKPENHFLNFTQVQKNNQLTSYNQIHEAFFTPLKNGADSFYQDKRVIISDSHVKVATFMNWIADTVKSKISRVEFDDLNSSHHLIDYLDFENDGIPTRILGFEAGALANPATIPQLMNANHVLLFISGNTGYLTDMMRQLSPRHLQAIKQCGHIECYFSKSAQGQTDNLHSTLSALDISAKSSDLQPNNFTEIWKGMRDSMQKGNPIIVPMANNHKQEVSVIQQISDKPLLPKEKAATETKSATTLKNKVSKDLNNPDLTRSTTQIRNNTGETTVANIKDSLAELMKIDGAMGCFIADYNSGMLLAKDGGGINLDLAAAGNTEVIRAKMKVMSMLGIKDTIEDILITLGTQYHIIRPSSVKQGLFLYIVLDKAKSNLALSRFKLAEVEKSLSI